MGDWICEKKYDMEITHKYAKCGTAACIAGWAWKLTNPTEPMPWSGDVATEVLGITLDDRNRLFYWQSWPAQFGGYIDNGTKKSAKIAAARIEHFIRTGE